MPSFFALLLLIVALAFAPVARADAGGPLTRSLSPEGRGEHEENPSPSSAALLAQAAVEDPFADIAKTASAKAPRKSPLSFWIREEAAYRTASPEDWSKIKTVGYLSVSQRLSEAVKFKVSGRGYYDAVFDAVDTYPKAVKDDQQKEADLRETFVDVSLGDFDARLGKQTVVWGEAVGLFFADVVNAKDLREFVLPDFDYIRTPQWMADLSYQIGPVRLEAVWIPVLDFNRFAKPGAEFAYALPPLPAGTEVVLNDTKEPENKTKNSDGGGRLSFLVSGWDIGLFHFYAWDRFPTYFRTVDVNPATGKPRVTFDPEHTRIRQTGLTLSKSVDPVVLRAEFVYAQDRYFPVSDLTTPRGVLKKDSLDALIGLSYTPSRYLDTNIQVFERAILAHEDNLVDPKYDTSASLQLVGKLLDGKVKPEILGITSLRRKDHMVRPRISYFPADSWRLTLGYDLFGGVETGLFGQFETKDRVYAEVQYTY